MHVALFFLAFLAATLALPAPAVPSDDLWKVSEVCQLLCSPYRSGSADNLECFSSCKWGLLSTSKIKQKVVRKEEPRPAVQMKPAVPVRRNEYPPHLKGVDLCIFKECRRNSMIHEFEVCVTSCRNSEGVDRYSDFVEEF